MKNNKEIYEIFLENDEKFLDEFYFIDTDDKFIESVSLKIKEFNEEVKKFTIDKYDTFMKYINMKINNKSIMSYSYFSKWLNKVNLTLSLVKIMPKEEVVKLLNHYNEELVDEKSDELNRYLALVLSFSKSSQSKGHTFKPKLKKQFEAAGYMEKNEVDFIGNQTFTLNDNAIMSYIYKNGIEFVWSEEHEKKKPDFLFVDKNGNVYIGEHKNIKESGGAQDKQINEIISFISFDESESNIYYVSYCDGPYFNNSKRAIEDPTNKKATQLFNIKQHIESTKNYFVNTIAFENLLNDN